MNNFPDTDDTPDKITDVSDMATARELENMEISRREHAKAVVRTQEARDDGSYDITECVECGNEIGLGRLMHSIKNTVCIHCATAAEKRKKGST